MNVKSMPIILILVLNLLLPILVTSYSLGVDDIYTAARVLDVDEDDEYEDEDEDEEGGSLLGVDVNTVTLLIIIGLLASVGYTVYGLAKAKKKVRG